MDKIKELKNIIFELKMQLLEAKMPKGYCPYSLYHSEKEIDCNIGCDKCRMIFLKDIEKDIRAEVENL